MHRQEQDSDSTDYSDKEDRRMLKRCKLPTGAQDPAVMRRSKANRAKPSPRRNKKIIAVSKRLHKTLASRGDRLQPLLTIVKQVPGDGNCFYHAVEALSGMDAKYLRGVATEEIEFAHPMGALVKQFGQEEIKDRAEQNAKEGDNWATHVEVQALCVAHTLNLWTIREEEGYVSLIAGRRERGLREHFMAEVGSVLPNVYPNLCVIGRHSAAPDWWTLE